MFSPVSWASCSRMCLVGFGVATNAAFNVSSCLALMVVRGPRLLVPEFCSSFSILFVSLSDDVELSVSFMSSCIGSCRSGDKLLSVHDDTGEREGKQTRGRSRSEMSKRRRRWRRREVCFIQAVNTDSTGKCASKILCVESKTIKYTFLIFYI